VETSKIEELLEEISSKLDEINMGFGDIYKQLLWFSGGSFAEKVIETLREIRNEIKTHDRNGTQ
jgi:hypothetical protein